MIIDDNCLSQVFRFQPLKKKKKKQKQKQKQNKTKQKQKKVLD